MAKTQENGRRVEIADPGALPPRPRGATYWQDDGVWYCCPPGVGDWMFASLVRHDVTEHDDGTITVSPSILLEANTRAGDLRWHGYLEAGVWRALDDCVYLPVAALGDERPDASQED